MALKNQIPEEVWDEQGRLYALGLKHGNEIARDLRVSPQTVSREMKRRGIVKASRVGETVKNLEALLDHKAMVRTRMEIMDSKHRRQASEALTKQVGNMVAALVAASENGDITLANPVIENMEGMVGGRKRRRRRRQISWSVV